MEEAEGRSELFRPITPLLLPPPGSSSSPLASGPAPCCARPRQGLGGEKGDHGVLPSWPGEGERGWGLRSRGDGDGGGCGPREGMGIVGELRPPVRPGWGGGWSAGGGFRGRRLRSGTPRGRTLSGARRWAWRLPAGSGSRPAPPGLPPAEPEPPAEP